jgi:lysine 6-dehydrogenase
LAMLQGHAQIATRRFDVRDTKGLKALVMPFDLVISAVPGFLGFQTITAVIEAGKDLVDISFLPEDVLPLDSMAKANGVTAITDCGVAPGLPNLIAGYHHALSTIHRFEYMVGGLPRVRTLPFEYKAPFSPCDVIEEYTRPARLKENGQVVTKPAMSDRELIWFEEVGTLEAFNSDGLRSLLYTLPSIGEMCEKTLRYPGHIDKIIFLRDAGFFGKDPIKVGDASFTPFDLTTEVLKKGWFLHPEEEEFTIMRIMLNLEDGEGRRTVQYHLYDTWHPQTGISSMARTTGYTCTAAAHLILNGIFNDKGVFPPECVGKHSAAKDFVFNYLVARDVLITCTEGSFV